MNMYAARRKLGKVYGSRVACRLDKKNAPEPDIVFVSTAHLGRAKRGGVQGAPDLAVEIVSSESVDRDYDKKRQQYERFGIPEYWIIDEEEQTVLLLQLDDKGKYRETRPRKGIFHGLAMTGFWLDPRWLWQRPLPDLVETLQRLLGG